MRYPRPISDSTPRRSATLVPPKACSASSTVMDMSSGRVCGSAPFGAYEKRSASFEYLDPPQDGQTMSTSGRNWTSRVICPVPSHSQHLSLPVL